MIGDISTIVGVDADDKNCMFCGCPFTSLTEGVAHMMGIHNMSIIKDAMMLRKGKVQRVVYVGSTEYLQVDSLNKDYDRAMKGITYDGQQ